MKPLSGHLIVMFTLSVYLPQLFLLTISDMKDQGIGTSSDAQRLHTQNKLPSRFNVTINTPRKLPLKAVLFGVKHLMEGYSIFFRPYSSSAANAIILKGPDNYAETITFAQSVESVAIGRVSEANPCVQITTKSLDSRNFHRTLFPGIGRNWGDDFQQGVPGCRGTVTLKFDPTSNSWSNELFNEFQFLCRNAAKHYRELVGQDASNLLWNETFEAASVRHDEHIVNEESKAESPEYRSLRRISSVSTLEFKKSQQKQPKPVESLSPRQSSSSPTKRRKISPVQDTQSTRASYNVDGTPGSKQKAQDVSGRVGLDTLKLKHQGTTILPPKPKAAGKPKSSHINDDDIVLKHSPTNMQLTKRDFDRLPNKWLNDNLVEFLLKLWHYELSQDQPQLANQIHTYNSFFYQKLSDIERKSGLKIAPRWDKGVDIFSKRFLIVPIHEWDHWYLAIIYRPDLYIPQSHEDINTTTQSNHTDATLSEQTLILIMDSLGWTQDRAIGILGTFLHLEAKAKNGVNLTRPNGRSLMVPRQSNNNDCGIYIVHFVRMFVEKAEHLLNVSNTRPSSEVETDWEGARVKGLREEFGRKISGMCALWRAEEQETV